MDEAIIQYENGDLDVIRELTRYANKLNGTIVVHKVVIGNDRIKNEELYRKDIAEAFKEALEHDDENILQEIIISDENFVFDCFIPALKKRNLYIIKENK